MLRNRTYKYLFPTINVNSSSMLANLLILIKSGGIRQWGIGDITYNKQYGRFLFIKIDVCGKFDGKKYTNIPKFRKEFTDTIQRMRQHEHYVDDYIFGDISHRKYHVIVIRVNEKYYEAYDKFLLYQYSEMYDESTLKRMGVAAKEKNGEYKSIYKVLTKDEGYRNDFSKLLNAEFGTDVSIEDDRELDLPFNARDEIFNYK